MTSQLSDEQHALLDERGASAAVRGGATQRARRQRRDAVVVATARAQVPHLAASELFVAGVIACWAEGEKNKPWRDGAKVMFASIDPDLGHRRRRPPEAFSRTTLKRHRSATIRKDVGDTYHGCSVITVRRSKQLNLQITGWWNGIVGGCVGAGETDRYDSSARSGMV